MKHPILKSILLILVIAALLAGFFAYAYWQHQQRYLISRKAVLMAEQVIMVAPMTGTLATLGVANNSAVKPGDLLFSLDARAYQATLQQANNNLQAAQSVVKTLQQNIINAQKTVEANQQAVSTLSKQIFQLQQQYLFTDQSDRDTLRQQLHLAKQDLADSIAQSENALQAYGPPGVAVTKVKQAKKVADEAQKLVDATQVKAPLTGVIRHIVVKPGEKVRGGQKVLSIIKNNDWWIEAYFNPVVLKRIQAQQVVQVEWPTNSNHIYTGVVTGFQGQWVIIRLLNFADYADFAIGSPAKIIIDTHSSRF